jgi:Tol biopolymer transport system component
MSIMGAVNDERVRVQLARILAGTAFTGAERAAGFLRFVVERALDGRTEEIKESVIAVEVLGRSPSSFDSKSDPIVRVEAGRLRDRLDSYYRDEGKSDRIFITMPKGGYVPKFSERPVPKPKRVGHPALVFAAGTLLGFAVAVMSLFYLRNSRQPGDLLRVSIAAPAGGYFQSFVISPDGRKLAFTSNFNGKPMLWMSSLDSLEVKPLAGTENASNPFWSPDSRSVAFSVSATAKLKSIDIEGGPARDISDTIVGCGGAWNDHGVIIFCPRPVGPLYEVAASGGAPKQVTSLNTVRSEISDGFPQFLPDGDHFLYLAMSIRPGESAICLGSLSSATSKVLLKSNTSAAYAPVLRGYPASLLFVYGGALMAQPLDLHSLELSGERTVVVREIRHLPWRQARFSVSNQGVLVYQGGRTEDHRLAWLDRHGRLLSTVGLPNEYFGFSLSPDGKHLAINRNDDPATPLPMIWVMDISHADAVSRFTDSGAAEADFGPVWSPDGKQILYSQGDDRRMRLLRRPLEGGSTELVLDTSGPKFPVDFSSEGGYIAYDSAWPDYLYLHTWIVPLSAAGQKVNPLPFLQHPYEEFGARFSPESKDGTPRWIAYTSNETGREEVYVRDFPSGTRRWQISTNGGLLSLWRSDGRELFYLTPDGMLMSVTITPAADFRFSDPKALFQCDIQYADPNTLFTVNQYDVSHDGQRFLFNNRAPGATSDITAVIPR